ncbi:hypothetical protein [Vibrio phage vB_VmeM-Yong XC32]|nr:hypothetical protein [Vibrio phage vB_VmeM-Yong XC31]QAX96439.1 hypothetical protein [Vibrio phage vB_VmeM-Yong XC32]QAX96756.1 hypothetical protein [Vibrio phage vB_VmeM-Yong MS31]QAX97075.1 hypothetical protein [Vibrio phage vB_VmeM-Yong MS32]
MYSILILAFAALLIWGLQKAFSDFTNVKAPKPVAFIRKVMCDACNIEHYYGANGNSVTFKRPRGSFLKHALVKEEVKTTFVGLQLFLGIVAVVFAYFVA